MSTPELKDHSFQMCPTVTNHHSHPQQTACHTSQLSPHSTGLTSFVQYSSTDHYMDCNIPQMTNVGCHHSLQQQTAVHQELLFLHLNENEIRDASHYRKFNCVYRVFIVGFWIFLYDNFFPLPLMYYVPVHV